MILATTSPSYAQTLDRENQKQWLDHYMKQKNAPKPEEMLLNTDPEPNLTDGFEQLFNGKDLSGWQTLGGKCKFEAKDGMILGTCVPGTDSTYLCTKKSDYTDFVFTCDLKWEEDGNSGIMFRAKQRPGKNDKVVVYGPQAEMEEHTKKRGWSGGVYGQSCGGYFYPLWLEEHKDARAAQNTDWNRITIHAQGSAVKTWINGVPAAHWVDKDGEYESGYFGLQIHKGKKGKILFRNASVKELVKE